MFPSIDITVSADASSKKIKSLRQAKLAPLAGLDATPNPPFIYVPPEWKLDDNGKIQIDGDGKKIMIQPPRRPFFSPYIVGVFKVLWFGENARWRDLKLDHITASQLAFVCGLVRYILII